MFVSVPFTWNLPALRAEFEQRDFQYDAVVVGGPAVQLMPGMLTGLPHVTIGDDMPGVMQRINPLATVTTRGCPNKCKFCAVPFTEGWFRELSDWPDLPVLCDNNLLECSQAHFDRVMDRLERHKWCDFNQGLDCRRLTAYHAERIGRIKGAIVRLALDNTATEAAWLGAAETLHEKGTAWNRIRSYVLCGHDSGIDDAWKRCGFVEKVNAMPLPQWFHELDATEENTVTAKQAALGWTDDERKRIMRHYYRHTDGNGSHR